VVGENQRISFDEMRNLEFHIFPFLNNLNLWANNLGRGYGLPKFLPKNESLPKSLPKKKSLPKSLPKKKNNFFGPKLPKFLLFLK